MKKFLWALAVVALIGALLFVASGFGWRADVFVWAFDLSEDGQTMTLHTEVFSSMGYTRAVRIKQECSALYCTFYTAFGGLNSKIGAKNTFTVPVEGCTEIRFYRGDGMWTAVLQKDPATGAWDWVR